MFGMLNKKYKRQKKIISRNLRERYYSAKFNIFLFFKLRKNKKLLKKYLKSRNRFVQHALTEFRNMKYIDDKNNFILRDYYLDYEKQEICINVLNLLSVGHRKNIVDLAIKIISEREQIDEIEYGPEVTIACE